jgi:hypothetical protein
MRRWAFLVGGLPVWAAHFLGVYVLASVADLRTLSEQPLWRGAHFAFSAICFATAAWIAIQAHRRSKVGDPSQRFAARLSTLGASLGLVAIFWQSLPALF